MVVGGGRLMHMGISKPEGERRQQVLYLLDPENRRYVEEKGRLFGKGRRGGNSEALNRMIEFVRGYEERHGKDL